MRDLLFVEIGGKVHAGYIVCAQGINNVIAEDSKLAKFVTEFLGRYMFDDWGFLFESGKGGNEYRIGKYLTAVIV